ncbi:hypothetical protein [Loktanella salsilacus]|uniref:hypothetical protein n=1 Tax=Loktanella salsilacus TaxID=195913 RepID=UPI0030F7579F
MGAHQSGNRSGIRRVHMAGLSGHRQSYQDLFAQLFALTPSTGKITFSTFISLVGAKALLFGTIDDDYRGFLTVSIARAFLGRRTVGLFLRPQTCFGPSGLLRKLKKFTFIALKRVPFVSVFTIIPFSVAPEYRKIATGSVFDPQIWDADISTWVPRDAALAEQLNAAADGRRILAFIGTANPVKGIEFLSQLVTDPAWPREVCLPVVAGKFPEAVRPLVELLASKGALVLDRFISDDEIQTLYIEADLIWACYRPDYDQASGIFGRALQFGKTPVVRAGSLIAKFAGTIPTATVELNYGASGQAAKFLEPPQTGHQISHLSKMIEDAKHEFETVIGSAL